MPIVHMTLVAGRTSEQKTLMFQEVTDAIHRTLGTPKENIRIIISEIPAEHFATAGLVRANAAKTESS